jgi:hypothetical protein
VIVGQTLLFFDEIQESPQALKQLRYFYEKKAELHVIAAGSFLELTLREKTISFPVGRTDNIWMAPLNFDEFLQAIGETNALNHLRQFDLRGELPQAIHEIFIKLFHEYVIVRGMPEAVALYKEKRSFGAELISVYANLQLGFQDDVYKYASKSRAQHLRHVIRFAPSYSGRAIVYEGFADSNYRSREMSDALVSWRVRYYLSEYTHRLHFYPRSSLIFVAALSQST